MLGSAAAVAFAKKNFKPAPFTILCGARATSHRLKREQFLATPGLTGILSSRE